MTNVKFRKQSKITNVVIIGNDIRFSRMMELEFIRNGFNCKNFNIASNITAKNNYYFSDILNYCKLSQCSLLILIPNEPEKYESSYGEFINLSRKMLDANIIFISYRNATKDFNDNIIAKNNVIFVHRPFKIEQFFKEIKIFTNNKNKLKNVKNKVVQVNDLTIDGAERTAYYKNEQLPLTKREFDLLSFFANHRGKALSREEIFSNVWEVGHIGDTNVVDVVVRNLRGKLDQKYQVKFIHTIRGVGYMMKNRL